jgi:hypothetical protein
MKIVVRVEPITDRGEVNTIELGRIGRPSQTLDAESVGLSMAEGKQLLHNLQQAVIPPRPTKSAPCGASVDDVIAGRR